jgi:hypothetical protein
MTHLKISIWFKKANNVHVKVLPPNGNTHPGANGMRRTAKVNYV